MTQMTAIREAAFDSVLSHVRSLLVRMRCSISACLNLPKLCHYCDCGAELLPNFSPLRTRVSEGKPQDGTAADNRRGAVGTQGRGNLFQQPIRWNTVSWTGTYTNLYYCRQGGQIYGSVNNSSGGAAASGCLVTSDTVTKCSVNLTTGRPTFATFKLLHTPQFTIYCLLGHGHCQSHVQQEQRSGTWQD